MTAVLTTYRHPFPGREKKALDFAVEAAEFWGKLAAEGKCTQPEQFYSRATNTGYWLVKGDLEELTRLQTTPEVKKLMAKGDMLMDGWTVDLVLADDEVEDMFMYYAGEIDSGS